MSAPQRDAEALGLPAALKQARSDLNRVTEAAHIGRIAAAGRVLRYEFKVPPGPCAVRARAYPDAPFRPGVGSVDASGNVDLAPIVALSDGDYLYRVGARDAEVTRDAEVHLESAAMAFAAGLATSIDEHATSSAVFASYTASKMYLLERANAYAGALGEATALERADLAALRRFYAGVVALRAELTACSDLNLVKETIDALVALGPKPKISAFWASLTAEQRQELIADCCRGCGSLDTSCRCWDDT